MHNPGYIMFFHLSVMSFILIPLGNIILPLILWLTKKDKIVGLKKIGANVLNYQIIWTVLSYISIGIFVFYKIQNFGNLTILLYTYIGLVLLPLSCFRKVAVYFCSDQGAMMEHSQSYVTEEQRRYEQKDQELVYINLVVVT